MKYYLEIELRTFDELSEKEKEKVTQEQINLEREIWDGDDVIEEFKNSALEKYGFDVDEVYYSGVEDHAGHFRGNFLACFSFFHI